LFLEGKDLLIVLIGFLSVFVLGTLEFLIQTLNLDVEVLFLVAETLELALRLEASTDVGFEGGVGELTHFGIELLKEVDQVVFIGLDFFLVALHVWVVLQLSAQGAGGVLELFGYSLRER
jgi:hypothetical protein